MTPKIKIEDQPPQRESLGLSPAVLAKRSTYKPETWGPNIHPLMVHYDPWCDPFKPKTIHYRDVKEAYKFLKDIIPPTPLTKANRSADFNMNLYFKRETVHKTGSYFERGAIYALNKLTEEQRKNGIYTASYGNWATSLLYYAKKMDIPVTAYIPTTCQTNYLRHFFQYGDATVIAGYNLAESRNLAIDKMRATGVTDCYINGCDHPNVIAASGTVAFEILDQCPEVDAILIPVSGGALIASVAAVVKKVKPSILVYGMESDKHRCLFDSMVAGQPVLLKQDKTANNIGYNSFHTLQPLIDKVILVNDDSIARALLYYVEEERFLVENKSTTALAALFTEPNILPELRDKTVVCLVTCGYFDYNLFLRTLDRGKSVAGRMVTMKVALPLHRTDIWANILSTVARLGCSIQTHDMEHSWCEYQDMGKVNMIIDCETKGPKHTSLFKNVMTSLYPNMVEFSNYTCPDQVSCPCYPKIWPL